MACRAAAMAEAFFSGTIRWFHLGYIDGSKIIHMGASRLHCLNKIHFAMQYEGSP